MSPPVASPGSPSLWARAQNRLVVGAIEGAIRIAEGLGIDRSLRFGAAFGRAWHALHGPRTARVRRQLAEAFPELSVPARRALERQVFEHLGQGLGELLLLLGRHRLRLLDAVEVVGLEHLEQAKRGAGGIGAIVIGPHLGNWELGAAKLAAIGVPVAAVYRDAGQPALAAALREVRSGRLGASAADAAEPIHQIAMGRRAGVQFVRALESGRNVLVLLDQHARREEGMLVQFFGRPASTRFGPLKLAQRTGAPVLMAFARRDPDRRHHRLTFHPALQIESEGSDETENLRRHLQSVTDEIEKEIRKSPGQWIWTHRRWRGNRKGPGSD